MGKGKLPDYDDAEKVQTGLIEFDDEKCTRCGICASLCPGRAIVVPPKVEGEKRGIPYLNEIAPNISPCMSCGDCTAACPTKAITIIRGFTVKKPYRYYRISQSPTFTFPKKY